MISATLVWNTGETGYCKIFVWLSGCRYICKYLSGCLVVWLSVYLQMDTCKFCYLQLVEMLLLLLLLLKLLLTEEELFLLMIA